MNLADFLYNCDDEIFDEARKLVEIANNRPKDELWLQLSKLRHALQELNP